LPLFENRILKRIFGHKMERKEQEAGKLHNLELILVIP
jgi:hypothetical protein